MIVQVWCEFWRKITNECDLTDVHVVHNYTYYSWRWRCKIFFLLTWRPKPKSQQYFTDAKLQSSMWHGRTHRMANHPMSVSHNNADKIKIHNALIWLLQDLSKYPRIYKQKKKTEGNLIMSRYSLLISYYSPDYQISRDSQMFTYMYLCQKWIRSHLILPHENPPAWMLLQTLSLLVSNF